MVRKKAGNFHFLISLLSPENELFFCQVNDLSPVISGWTVCQTWGSCIHIKQSSAPVSKQKISTAELKKKMVCPAQLYCLILQPYETTTGQEPWLENERKKAQFPFKYCLQTPKYCSPKVCFSQVLKTSCGAFWHLTYLGTPAKETDVWELAEQDMCVDLATALCCVLP